MNKEKMLKWAEALVSGKYEQCRYDWGKGSNSFLPEVSASIEEQPEGFCCLHVALVIEKEEYNHHRQEYQNTRAPSYDILSDIYGLSDDEKEQFVRWNDDDELTFPQIAEKIEEMVEGVEA